MNKIYSLLLITLFTPYLLSCEKKEPISCEKTDNSLVYIRGEKQDGEEELNAFTGFIIAKEKLKGTNKYYVLTAQHNLKDKNEDTVFKVIPFILRRSVVFKKGYLKNSNLFLSVDNNQFRIEEIKNIGTLDASIISFTSNSNLPVACIKSSKLTSDSNQKIEMAGFVKCPNEDSENKYYFKHGKSGVFFSQSKLSQKIEKVINEDEIKYLQIMENMEKSERNVFSQKGINLRYEIPSKYGMSGAPVFNENHQVIALHNKSFRPELGREVDNCTVSPQTPYSYGISMEKILSSDFPDSIKRYMSIQD